MRPPKTEEYLKMDWSLQDVTLARRHNLTRERIRQIRIILGKPMPYLFRRKTVGPPRVDTKRPSWAPTLRLIIGVLSKANEALELREKRLNEERIAIRRARDIAYYRANRDEFKKRRQEWGAKNKDKIKAYNEAHKSEISAQRKAIRERNRIAAGKPSVSEYLASIRKYPNEKARKRADALRQKDRMAPVIRQRKYARGRQLEQKRFNEHERKVEWAMWRAYRATAKDYERWWKRLLYRRQLEEWRSSGQRQISKRVRASLKRHMEGEIKTTTIELLGCSIMRLREHLEFQFRPGWNWDNYGTRWNIDHIIPLCKFDLSDPDQRKQASHYRNLRPMAVWANSLKSDRIIKKAVNLKPKLAMMAETCELF